MKRGKCNLANTGAGFLVFLFNSSLHRNPNESMRTDSRPSTPQAHTADTRTAVAARARRAGACLARRCPTRCQPESLSQPERFYDSPREPRTPGTPQLPSSPAELRPRERGADASPTGHPADAAPSAAAAPLRQRSRRFGPAALRPGAEGKAADEALGVTPLLRASSEMRCNGSLTPAPSITGTEY